MFLRKLAERRLIAVVTSDPDPLAATYALTDAGRHAAEYGEYECDGALVAVACDTERTRA